MFTGQVAVISSKATWDSRGQPGAIEPTDELDDSAIDLDDPDIGLDIVVTIKDFDGCTLATASLANGKVFVTNPTFYWQFEVGDLAALCARTYRLGVKITINGTVDDLIDGTIAVIEGN